MALYSLDDISPKLHDSAWVAPSADVMGHVEMDENSSVWFGAVLRGDNEPIIVGANSNIQDMSVLHTDIGAPLTIGEGVTVGHKVTLHGCEIGDYSLIGMGATILNHAKIGKNCIIGAGALVTGGQIIPDGSLVLGVPAKVVKQLSEEQISKLKLSAQSYVLNAKRFRSGLKKID